MDIPGLTRLEELCVIVYGGQQTSQVIAAEAHKVLLALQTRATFLPQVVFLLGNGKTPYSILYAANSILSIVSKDWKNIPEQRQEELVPMLMTFLVKNQNNDMIFITKAVIRCLSRVIKEGWMNNKNFNKIFENIQKLLDSPNERETVLGLQILGSIVVEFDVTNSEHNDSKPSSAVSTYAYRILARYDASKRLLSQAFREQGLNKAFRMSFAYVEKGRESGSAPILKEALLGLLCCLKFDFVGTGQESTDESVNCLYIPMDWAESIARGKSLLRLFDIYDSLWGRILSNTVDAKDQELMKSSASLCLEMLSQIRRAFLVVLLEQTTKIMQSKLGLDKSENCLHHFCRLLAAIKSHFTLVDLTQPSQYQAWLAQLTNFTSEILQAWSTVSNRTVHYVIKLWASLVIPTPYLQARDGFRSNPGASTPPYLQGLDTFVPQIVKTFIYSRCEICSSSQIGQQRSSDSGQYFQHNAIFGGDEDFLDEEGLLLDTLSPVAFKEIQALYNESLHQYSSILANINNVSPESTKIFLSSQARLTFLNYLIGAIIGSHVSRVSAAVIKDFDQTNMELAALVFGLINSMNQQNNTGIDLSRDTGFRLEMSCLYFVKCFQNLYIESRARLEADKDKIDSVGDLSYGFPYPNLMYDSIRGLRGPNQRNSMEEDDTAAKSEGKLKRLQEDINNRFGTSVLDMALQKVFRILSQMSETQESTVLEQSNRIVLTEKCLSVLHQLSIGVTVVHAGRSFAPKLMSSGKLLLESKTIQTLLISPEARNFPLLTDPAHYKSRAFLMATLAKLLFTQLRNIPSTGVTLDMASFQGVGFDLQKLFSEINRIIFNNSSSLNTLAGNLGAGSERSHMGDDTEIVIVSGDGVITVNHTGSSLLALQNSANNQDPADIPLYLPNFYQKREFTRIEVCDILFVQFMKPLDTSFQKIGNFLSQQQPNQSFFPELRKSILVLFRDLKGILSSCAIAREYELFFSWLFPEKIRILSAIPKLFWADDTIMASVFKLLKDLVHNKGSRISFGSSFNAGNVAGTVLFKEACNIALSFIQPKLESINQIKSKEAQDQKLRISQSVSNENILKDLSLITGVKSASPPQPTNGFHRQGEFLSLNTLKEAVMNIEKATTSSDNFSLTSSRKKDGSTSKNSLKLDFGACGVGITVNLKKITETEANSKLVKILSSLAQILCRIVSGRFANIACFKVYNDDILKKTIHAALDMLFIAEPYQIVLFPKLANNVIELIYILCSNAQFLLFVVENNPSLLTRIVATLAEVINIEENFGSAASNKSVSLEEVASDVAHQVGAQNTNKVQYNQFKGIIGKASVALHNLVELRCRSVAFNFVNSNSTPQSMISFAFHFLGSAPEMLFNTKLSFLSLELRTVLDPEFRPSLSSGIHNNQAFTHEMLSRAAKYFGLLDANMPNLFPELLTLILSKLFTLSVSEENVMGNSETQRNNTERVPKPSYSLRVNAKKIAKTILPLILTAPHTFEQFKSRVLSIHSNNGAKQSVIEGRFAKLFKVLKPAITTTNGMGVGPNPAYFEPLLRQNDAFSKEICKLARDLNE